MFAERINQRESDAISILRILAMFSIVACHISQGLESRWAWILNVGVQIFLVMSGYLYGHKEIKGWKQWYVKRIGKLYVPYVLFVFLMLFLYTLFANSQINIQIAASYLFDIQGLIGGG